MKRVALMEHIPKPPPYPYWKKQCNDLHMMFDPMSLRYDDNSKLIIVEGPPAVGKTKLCEEIAKEYGLLYMPPPTHDEIFINPYGFDVRSINSKLPPSFKHHDLNDFLKDPYHELTAVFQLGYFLMKFEQYLNALLHILASGQGVVLNRCIYTEAAFMHAMYNAGYISKPVVNNFERMRLNTFKFLLKPHLVIYLDASPEVTLERIKQRGNINEINSKVFTINYLSDLENATKQTCLGWLSSQTEIVTYDWNKAGNNMDIVYDIEQIDLEEDTSKQKFYDWLFSNSEHIIDCMALYQDKILIYNNIDGYIESEIPSELYSCTEERDEYDKEMEKIDSEQYLYGYNPKYDKIPIIKRPGIRLSLFRRTPRDFINCKYFSCHEM
ncbi:PREDICTED: NADH dehydrogenase [ubiquinone] 1 alpha subcomplex subunit 10, mitochondrial isoform X2 [Eufriesea mexicana]|nr:PREDICTED: NADH dehydrogenase [ubiquinone] 1 alpha subcomplex subunit 10, mitochondrial isoform X2 [Eufriesea mexicana]